MQRHCRRLSLYRRGEVIILSNGRSESWTNHQVELQRNRNSAEDVSWCRPDLVNQMRAALGIWASTGRALSGGAIGPLL